NSEQNLITGRGKTLTQRGGLRSDVVRTTCHHQGLVLSGMLTNASGNRDSLIPHQLQRAVDWQLLYVLSEITRCQALVNVLMTSQGVELCNTSYNVVAGDALTVRNRIPVYLVYDCFMSVTCFSVYVDAEVVLSAHDRDPELALHDDFVFRAPQVRKR